MNKKLNYKMVSKPDWIKKAIRNAKARERYFVKKYGSLERMYTIDGKLQDRLDTESFEDEMIDVNKNTPID